jgi:hypothetical protein
MLRSSFFTYLSLTKKEIVFRSARKSSQPTASQADILLLFE